MVGNLSRSPDLAAMEADSFLGNNGEISSQKSRNERSEYNTPIEMRLLDEPKNPHFTKASSITTLTRHSDVYNTNTEPIVDRASRQRHSRYSPLALHPISLIGFVAIFTTLAVSLGILYGQSERHQGMATADESWHYIFKYGPTAGRLHIIQNRRAELSGQQYLLSLPPSGTK